MSVEGPHKPVTGMVEGTLKVVVDVLLEGCLKTTTESVVGSISSWSIQGDRGVVRRVTQVAEEFTEGSCKMTVRSVKASLKAVEVSPVKGETVGV